MKCELLEGCVFFNTLHQHAIDALKEVYCTANPLLCARRQVANAVGREHVPPKLDPNHTHLVRGIVEAVLLRQ